MKKIAATLAVVVLALAALTWSRHREPASAGSLVPIAESKADAALSGGQPVPSGDVSTAASTASGMPLGGPGFNAQKAFRDAVARHGSGDRTVAASVQLASWVCSEYAARDPGEPIPVEKRGGAAYLDQACAGFDSAGFKYQGSDHDALWVKRNLGEEKAIDKAREDFETADNYFDLGAATTMLAEHNLLPGGDYGLSKEELMQAASTAAKLKTCAALSACGSDSLLTADFCYNYGCKPGATYAEAVRQVMSPRQYQAALAIRDRIGHPLPR